jgi:hypothetical protein
MAYFLTPGKHSSGGPDKHKYITSPFPQDDEFFRNLSKVGIEIRRPSRTASLLFLIEKDLANVPGQVFTMREFSGWFSSN